MTLCLCTIQADSEYQSHGTPSKNFEKDHHKNGHNNDMDHQAVLGLSITYNLTLIFVV